MSGGGVIIIKKPSAVVVEAMASVTPDEADLPLFNECMAKAEDGWSEGEAHFMCKHIGGLPNNWYESD